MLPDLTKNALNYVQQLKATDGRVGALWPQSSSFITSIVETNIPIPPNDHAVHVMADGRFGCHDVTRWPQFYDSRAPHFAAIPLAPQVDETNHRYYQYRSMWSDVEGSDIRWSTGSVGGIGLLKAERFTDLRSAVVYLKSRGTEYSTSKAASPEIVKFISLRTRRLQAYLDRLEVVENDVMSLKITLAGLQRLWLDLLAGLDYAEIYQPIMNGENFTVVELFMPTPIPIFFIRPFISFSNQVILRVVELVKPPSQVFPSPRLPVVYTGPPTNTEKLDAMVKFLATFLSYKDPFTESGPLAGPSSSHASRKPSSGPIRPKKTKSNPSKLQSTPQNKKQVGQPKVERDKFQDLDGPYAPHLLPAWININKEIQRDAVEKTIRESGVNRPSKYAFPDPGMLTNPELQDITRTQYFIQLNHIFDALIYRRTSSVGGGALRPQEWRDILSLPRFIENPDNHRRNESVSKAKDLLGACFASQGVSIALVPPVAPDPSVVYDVVQGRRLVWKLCELNFRCELASLDRVMWQADDPSDELDRSSKVLRIFPENSLTTIYPSLSASYSLCASDWTARSVHLDAFRELMKDWPRRLPPVLEETFASQLMGNTGMERALVRHYAQCFFDSFQRPPVLPCVFPN